ncbi:MAG: HAD hydrolase-like protein, partial [Actinobacteria bacterium]|nr:HAD hydrolase-like protein [Actinomycetota bacterium]
TGSAVLVLGTVGLEEALRERGLVPVFSADKAIEAVVQGYSPDLDWRQLAEGAVAINRGVPWVATNLDPTVPSPRGPLPGNGSLVAALRHATRVAPTIATGKPDPTMHRESLLRSGASHPIVVGDRLDTDIEGANAVGCPSLLVLSGVTTPADLLAAPNALRPTFLAADAAGLLVAHPELDVGADTVGCGAWSASSGDEALRLEFRGADGGASVEDLDALRALCAAYWTADREDPAGRSDEVGEPAVEAVGEVAAAVLRRLGLG